MRKERIDAQNLIKFISLLAIFSYVISTLILIKTGNPDLAMRGSITIGIPVILASLLAIIKPIVIPSNDFYNIIETNSNKYIILMSLLFIQLFILSIFVSAIEIERPIVYFLLIVLLAGILLVETIFLKLGHYAKIIVLLQIIFVSLNLCLGVTLKYPFFFGHTDIFEHLNIFRVILADGIISSSIGDYQYFPLFHVLNSIFTLFVGLNIHTSYFILSAFLVSFSVILIYLLCLYITKNVNISLLAALLYIFCEPIIYASLYVLPSTTAFFFILLILYLWIVGKRDIRLIMLSIFLILPLAILHQLSSVIFLFLMVLLLIINFYLGDFELLSYKYVILFLLSFVSYWIYLCGPFFEKIVKMIFSTRDAIYISNDNIMLPIWGVPIRNIDSILMTFITLTSAFIMLRQAENKMVRVFGLASIILLPLYIQQIASLFTTFIGYRLPFYLSVFIVIASSFGIYNVILKCMSNNIYKKAVPVILLILVVGYFLSSLILVSTSIDLSVLSDILGKDNRAYFTQEELSSFSFYESHRDFSGTGFSDYPVFRYFDGYLGLPFSCSIKVFDTRQLSDSSYFIFREGEYLSAGKLNFFLGPTFGYGEEVIKTWRINRDPYPSDIWSKKECIYNNEKNKLYYKLS